MNKMNQITRGKKLTLVVLAGALISTSGFLGQAANASSVPNTQMPANMVMPKVPAAPKVATPKVATPAKKVPVVAAVKTSYTLPLGTKYAKLTVTVSFQLKGKAKSTRTTIGKFVADKKGTITFSYKAAVPTTATIYLNAKGMKERSLSASLLRLLTTPKVAAPFVEPTPAPTLIPVPLPTPGPTVIVTPTPSPSSSTLKDALVPTFGLANPTNDGYTIQIANFDSAFKWTAKDSAGGKVSISSTGQITVVNLQGGTVTNVTVTSTQDGYNTGVASSKPINVLAAAAPMLPIMGGGGGGGGGTTYVYAPSIALSISSITVNQQEPLPTYVVNNTGGSVASYSISPSAPAGTTFDPLTGILSGAPTNGQGLTTYTITATNLSGKSTAQFALTVYQGVVQTIGFLAPYSMKLGAPAQILQGSSDSGLAITYTIPAANRSVCSLSVVLGNTVVTANAAGICVIDANQAGNATYLPAAQVERSFTVLASTSTSFVVNVDPNGGSNSTNNATLVSIVVPTGTTIASVLLASLTNPPYTSYTWAIGDVSGAVPTPSALITADMTLIAVWH
ncbi:MAG: hypothetical protein WCQ06_04230 [Actinomycetes bacterium]